MSPKRAAVIGLIIILGSEYLLRAGFVSKGSSGLQIGIAIGIEWIVALFILLYWIPKVEHRKLDSIRFRKFPRRYRL